MADMDPKDEIKQKINIEELIGEYINLKPSGTGGFKGLCPFHGEKTPSFHVSPDKEIWHCFGCGEGGDCFSFIQKMEGMSFPEVLLHLGNKVGVEVKRFDSKEGNERLRMLDVHDLAAKFYRQTLKDSPKGAAARAYEVSRGISAETSELFGLGFAPDSWSDLSDFLTKRGFVQSELVLAGLSLKKKTGSGVIDRFRNRYMVPLRDQHGNVVGFTGRVMPGSDDSSAKYMNSPETPVYHKGSLLFGLDVAKRAIKQSGFVVITEGNLDVVASHKAGVKNVVASSGTALTEDHLKLLSRYTKTIVFAFDADAAGFAAAKKGISSARSLDFDVRSAILPNNAKDPDDLVQSNPQAWHDVTHASVPIMEYIIEQVKKGKDLSSVDDKRKMAAELLPAVREIQNIIEREHWLEVVSSLLSVDASVLRSSITPKEPEKAKIITPNPATAIKPRASRMDQVFMHILGFVIHRPEHGKKVFSRLSEEEIPDGSLRILYKNLHFEYDQDIQSAQLSFFSRVRSSFDSHKDRDELQSLLDECALLAEQLFTDTSLKKVLEQLDRLLETVRSSSSQKSRGDLAMKIRQAELAGEHEVVEALIRELNNL